MLFAVLFCFLYHIIFLVLYELYRRHRIVSTFVCCILPLIVGPLVTIYGVWSWFGITNFYTIVICSWTVHILRFYPHLFENKLFNILSKFGFILICANIIEAAIREASAISSEIIPLNVITALILCITVPNTFINPCIVKSINPKQEKNAYDRNNTYDCINFDQSSTLEARSNINSMISTSTESESNVWSEEIELELGLELIDTDTGRNSTTQRSPTAHVNQRRYII